MCVAVGAKKIARLLARDAHEWRFWLLLNPGFLYKDMPREGLTNENERFRTILTHKNWSDKTLVHPFCRGFFSTPQNECAQPPLNMIFWGWVHPFCSDGCFCQHGGHGFCRKHILASLQGIPFCRENPFCNIKRVAQPLLGNFHGDPFVLYPILEMCPIVNGRHVHFHLLVHQGLHSLWSMRKIQLWINAERSKQQFFFNRGALGLLRLWAIWPLQTLSLIQIDLIAAMITLTMHRFLCLSKRWYV